MARGRPRPIRPADGLTGALTTRPALRAHDERELPLPEIRSEASRFETRPGRDRAPIPDTFLTETIRAPRGASSSTNSPSRRQPPLRSWPPRDRSSPASNGTTSTHTEGSAKGRAIGLAIGLASGLGRAASPVASSSCPMNAHAPARPCGFPMRSRFRRLRRRIPDHPHSPSKIEWWWSGNAGAQGWLQGSGSVGKLVCPGMQVQGTGCGQSHQQRRPWIKEPGRRLSVSSAIVRNHGCQDFVLEGDGRVVLPLES